MSALRTGTGAWARCGHRHSRAQRRLASVPPTPLATALHEYSPTLLTNARRNYHKLVMYGKVVSTPQFSPDHDPKKVHCNFVFYAKRSKSIIIDKVDDATNEQLTCRVNAFGALARLAARLHLGDSVLVEGRLMRAGKDQIDQVAFDVAALVVRHIGQPSGEVQSETFKND